MVISVLKIFFKCNVSFAVQCSTTIMIQFYHNTFVFTSNSSTRSVSASWLSPSLPNFSRISSSVPDGPGEPPRETEREEVGLMG
jgi:hypothetical protein